jgi:transposase-like protein
VITWLVTNKRKILDNEEKVKLSKEIENGVNNADVCQEFGLVNSTMDMIWKNRIKIFSAFEQNRLRMKCF